MIMKKKLKFKFRDFEPRAKSNEYSVKLPIRKLNIALNIARAIISHGPMYLIIKKEPAEKLMLKFESVFILHLLEKKHI